MRIFSIFALFLLCFCTACSDAIREKSFKEKLVIFPSPPDTTRIQFLTSISSSKDIEAGRSVFAEYVLGELPEKIINKPYGISSTKDKIYICDTMLPGLEVIDLKQKSFNYFVPDGLGQLKKPINCYVSSQGDLFIADVERRQVVVFNSVGKYMYIVSEGIEKPTDVIAYNDKIWVCDIDKHQVHQFEKSSRRYISSFPDVSKKEKSYLYSPTNLFVQNDLLYVTDTGAADIKVFDLSGNYVRTIGSRGNAFGQFVRPKGIAVDKRDNLFAVDAAFENVQIFNKDGKRLMFFGGSYKGPGYLWLPANVSIDYDNTEYFKEYVHAAFNLEYLIFVTNQYGPDKINVYGFVNYKNELTIK